MRRIFLLTSLAFGAALAPAAHAEPKTPATSAKIIAARQQTAIALRAVARPEDFDVLAQLGDYESARKLASREPENERGTVSLYIAQDAVQRDNFAVAEREIKRITTGYGATRLWVQLSKRYSQSKRPADAKRTAFYAVAQVQRDKQPLVWEDVAIRLCELNEQPAARRLFAVAKKELLDPDPLMGAPTDALAEVAAKCGFDDIALKYAGAFADFTLIPTYVQQNRDDMARRIIESSLKEMQSMLPQMRSQKKPQSKQEIAQSVAQYHAFLLLLLGTNQFNRGDSEKVTTTFREADTLLGSPIADPKWLELKLALLLECEATAQWELADEINAVVQEQLLKYAASADKPTEDSYKPIFAPQDQYTQARLASLELLLEPEKISLEDRSSALNRVRPRLSQYLSENPEKRLIVQLVLARAERVAGDAKWRDSLQAAQAEAFKSKAWDYLQLIAEAWQKAGESSNARALGLQALDLLKKSPPAPRPLPPNTNRLRVAGILIQCDLPSEALQLLLPPPNFRDGDWESTLAKFVRKYPAAPPLQLLQLPPAQRRDALRSWAAGLLPERPPFDDISQKTPGLSHPLMRPLFARPR